MKPDYTFATRLKSFVKNIEVNCCAGQEEKEYILRRCEEMLTHQRQNAIGQNEIDYLERTNNPSLTQK